MHLHMHMLLTTDGQRLAIWSPLALCYISYGENLLTFTVLGKTLCEACQHQQGRQGAEAALVSSGILFPSGLEQAI